LRDAARSSRVDKIKTEAALKVWQVGREWSIGGLELVERPEPEPGPGQITVQLRAASLIYRDLLTVQG